MRDVTGDKGSLCGVAGLYRAAGDTLLTVSSLKQLAYDDMRTILTQEMDTSSVVTLTDSEFLTEFNKCEWLVAMF